MPADRCDRRVIEERSAVGQGGPNAAVGCEDCRDQPGNVAQPGAGQLARVGFELARFIAVD